MPKFLWRMNQKLVHSLFSYWANKDSKLRPLLTSQGLINNSSFSFLLIILSPTFTRHYHSFKIARCERSLFICLLHFGVNAGHALFSVGVAGLQAEDILEDIKCHDLECGTLASMSYIWRERNTCMSEGHDLSTLDLKFLLVRMFYGWIAEIFFFKCWVFKSRYFSCVTLVYLWCTRVAHLSWILLIKSITY